MQCQVFGDLFRLSVEEGGGSGEETTSFTSTWSRLVCQGGPKARSAHQAVLKRGASAADDHKLFIFGGEYTSPTQTRFQHYGDTWCLSLPPATRAAGARQGAGAQKGGGATAQWEQVANEGKAAANAPSPRSGHRAVLVEHQHQVFMAVFGGFFDNGTQVK